MADVIVRGLDVPRSCATCNRDLAATVNCIYTQRLVLPEEHDMRAGRHPLCPITPLPEKHGRLGDLSEIEKNLQKTLDGMGDRWLSSPTLMAQRVAIVADLNKVKEAPTFIPAEGGAEDG